MDSFTGCQYHEVSPRLDLIDWFIDQSIETDRNWSRSTYKGPKQRYPETRQSLLFGKREKNQRLQDPWIQPTVLSSKTNVEPIVYGSWCEAFTTEEPLEVESRKVKFNLPNLMRKPQTKRRQSLHVTNNARDPSKTHEGGHKKPKTSGKRVKVYPPPTNHAS